MTVAETVTGRGTQTAPELIPLLDQAAEAATKLRDRAVAAVAAKVASGGKIDGAALEREQHAAHGLAWIATYVEALRQLASYARRLDGEGRFGEMESLLAQIAAGEYLAQLSGGVMMSQSEVVRLHELGVKEADAASFLTPAVRSLIHGATPEARARVVTLIKQSQGTATFGDTGLDETLDAIRDEMRRFSQDRGRAACAGLASEGRICAAGADRPDERARRVLADAARRVWRARPRQGGDVRRLRGVVAAAISASARSARAPRSPRS